MSKILQSVPYPTYSSSERDGLEGIQKNYKINNSTTGDVETWTGSEWKAIEKDGGVTTHSELTGKDDEADFQHITSTEKTNLTDHINGANEAKHGAEQIVLVSEETVQSAIERIDNKDTSDLPLSTPLLGANNQDEYNVANESDKDAIKAQLAVNQLTFSSIYGYNNFI